MTKEITIKFDLNEDQLKALSELLPDWQQYISISGTKPFEDFTEEKLLQAILYQGSLHMIWRRIKQEQYRQGKITVDEMLDDLELTVEQRKEARQQAQKEGGAQ